MRIVRFMRILVKIKKIESPCQVYFLRKPECNCYCFLSHLQCLSLFRLQQDCQFVKYIFYCLSLHLLLAWYLLFSFEFLRLSSDAFRFLKLIALISLPAFLFPYIAVVVY